MSTTKWTPKSQEAPKTTKPRTSTWTPKAPEAQPQEAYVPQEAPKYTKPKTSTWTPKAPKSSAESCLPSEACSQTEVEQLEILKKSLNITVNPTDPELPYKKREKGEKLQVLHWGQRKLFFGELNFLTLYGHLSDVIVYAGAAPGTHIPYLTKLFPNKYWILVDPKPFKFLSSDKSIRINKIDINNISTILKDSAEQRTATITTINAFFDDAMAIAFSHLNPLFISDIRVDAKHQPPILENNCDQTRWHTLINAPVSMLKTKCLYPQTDQNEINAINKTKCVIWDLKEGESFNNSTPFAEGILYKQCWAPRSSTEVRLIVTEHIPKIYMYNNKSFEDKMFYFNNVDRLKRYPQPVKSHPNDGLKDTFDSSYEIVLLYNYLTTFGKLLPEGSIFKQLSDFSYEVTISIDNRRNLLVDIDEKE